MWPLILPHCFQEYKLLQVFRVEPVHNSPKHKTYVHFFLSILEPCKNVCTRIFHYAYQSIIVNNPKLRLLDSGSIHYCTIRYQVAIQVNHDSLSILIRKKISNILFNYSKYIREQYIDCDCIFCVYTHITPIYSHL